MPPKKTQNTADPSLTRAFSAIIARESGPGAFRLLNAIFTDKEMEFMEKRLRIGRLLIAGKSYSEIQNLLSVSAATVAAVSDQIKNEDFRYLIELIEREQSRFQWIRKWLKK